MAMARASQRTASGRRAVPRRAAARRPASLGARLNRPGVYVIGAVLLFCLLAAAPSFLILAAGMVPTMVALVVGDARNDGSLTVGGPNLVATGYQLVALWDQGHSLYAAVAMLSEPFVWAVMYGGAALGWALHLGLPILIETGLMFQHEQTLKRMQTLRQELLDTWGADVARRPGRRSGAKTDAPRRPRAHTL